MEQKTIIEHIYSDNWTIYETCDHKNRLGFEIYIKCEFEVHKFGIKTGKIIINNEPHSDNECKCSLHTFTDNKYELKPYEYFSDNKIHISDIPDLNEHLNFISIYSDY